MIFERKNGTAISFEKEKEYIGCTIKMERWNRRKGSQEAEISMRLFKEEIEDISRWFETLLNK